MIRTSPAYVAGYAAALWEIPRWCNPWPVLMPERLAWAMGHDDAMIDKLPRLKPRLAAEFERR